MNTAPTPLTRADLIDSDPSDRVTMVEQYALSLLAWLRPLEAKPLDGNSRLADAGIDSLQMVELKFSLDELLGRESEVEMFISNPSIRKLAEEVVGAAKL